MIGDWRNGWLKHLESIKLRVTVFPISYVVFIVLYIIYIYISARTKWLSTLPEYDQQLLHETLTLPRNKKKHMLKNEYVTGAEIPSFIPHPQLFFGKMNLHSCKGGPPTQV